jgi:hypothetical protein
MATPYRHRPLLALGLCGLLASSLAHGVANDAAMAPNEGESRALYWQGHEALKQGEWQAALEHFQSLEQRLLRQEPGSADAAVYWQAYALAKARRKAEAQAAVQRLLRDHPASRWAGDAQALLADSASPPATPEDDREDLVLIAIEGLLSAPPERAAPLLTKVLEGDYSTRAKKRALFVLSQSDLPDALDRVIGVARTGESALAKEAIQMLGINGQERAMDALYQGSSDAKLRGQVLQAWMIADRKDLVLNVARSEADSRTRKKAVHLLGAMGAIEELQVLFASGSDPELKSAVLQALGIAGATEALLMVARAPGDAKLRAKAIESLGVAGASAQLLTLYQQDTSAETRDAVLKGLLISGDGKALAKLYASASTDAEKRALLKVLTQLGDDSALDAIEAALDR